MTGNTKLSESQIVELKTKFTSWGLLDPAFANVGDPRIRTTHSSNWNAYCVDAAEIMLRLFGQEDADGILDVVEYDSLMKKGDPQPLRANDGEPSFERKTAKLIKAYADKNWYVARGNDVVNVCWIEDINRDWTSRSGALDQWDDMVVLWQAEHNGACRIIEEFWQATTEPGRFYTMRPLNVDGAARIAFGQYKAWQRGLHGSGKSAHQGFRQEAPIRVFRDLNKDGSRKGDSFADGIFYCNWHSTTDAPESIERWSAGCSVLRFMSQFRRFREILESDRRYKLVPSYFYMGAYIPGTEIAAY